MILLNQDMCKETRYIRIKKAICDLENDKKYLYRVLHLTTIEEMYVPMNNNFLYMMSLLLYVMVVFNSLKKVHLLVILGICKNVISMYMCVCMILISVLFLSSIKNSTYMLITLSCID